MPLITVVVALIVAGVLLWAVTTYVPMQPQIKSLLIAVVIISIVLWLLQVFGVLHTLSSIRVGR